MDIPGRQYNSTNGYRYGFNGKENDNSTGEGNLDFGARIYDSRLGRFLSVDPLASKFAYQGTYNYAENNPIRFIDIDGKSAGDPVTYVTPSGGTISLPTQSSVTYLGNLVNMSVNNGKVSVQYPTVNGKEISFAPGAVNTFTYKKETYEARFNLESGKFAGYYSQTNAKHYITSTANTLPDWEVNDPGKSSKHLQAGMTLVLSPNPGTKVPWVAIGTLATAGYLAYNATVNLLSNVNLTLPTTTTGDQSGFVPAVTTVLTKTLNDLVPGSLKRQKKWDDGYANKTPDEIDQLAKGGDGVAKTMKKIYEQSKRLLDKVKNSKKK